MDVISSLLQLLVVCPYQCMGEVGSTSSDGQESSMPLNFFYSTFLFIFVYLLKFNVTSRHLVLWQQGWWDVCEFGNLGADQTETVPNDGTSGGWWCIILCICLSCLPKEGTREIDARIRTVAVGGDHAEVWLVGRKPPLPALHIQRLNFRRPPIHPLHYF